MSLTKFTENTNVISDLPDTPGLTAQELKAKFDEVGNKVKNYLNNTLTTETEQLVATEKASLQQLISNLGTQITQNINNLRNEIHNEMEYSTEEVNTGKKWIDGKTIYRKTFTGNAMTNHKQHIDISNLNVDEIFFIVDKSNLFWQNAADSGRWMPVIQTSVKNNSGGSDEPYPTRYMVEVFTNEQKTRLTINCGVNVNISKWCMTIEYTKTTDATN